MFDEHDEPKTSDRTFYRYLFLALLIPAVGIGGLALMTEETTQGSASVESEKSFSAAFQIDLFGNGDEERMRKAAALLDNYTRLNPPNGVWRQQGVEVVDDETLRMTVEVPYRQHAQAIRTRRERIQYSYVKLACPPTEAGLAEYMNDDDRIVVQLRHKGETIAEGACPRHPFSL